jgi:hypothetical protein
LQRETLLQRGALALELAAARQAAEEAETARARAELGPALAKAKSLGKKVDKVQRERGKLQRLSEDMAASAAELHAMQVRRSRGPRVTLSRGASCGIRACS